LSKTPQVCQVLLARGATGNRHYMARGVEGVGVSLEENLESHGNHTVVK